MSTLPDVQGGLECSSCRSRPCAGRAWCHIHLAQAERRRPANKPKLLDSTGAASESAGANPTAAVWLGNCNQSDGADAMKGME